MIKKAVITAAGKGTRQYPATNSIQKELFPLVDRDGITKPVIQIIAEQVVRAGIDEIAIIVNPGEERQFKSHFKSLSENEKSSFTNKKWGLRQSEMLAHLENSITYLYQEQQEGYGHAVNCAADWVGDEPFLLLLGDHLYVSQTDVSCVQQVIEGYKLFKKSIYAVKQTPAELLYLFGTVAGEQIPESPNAYQLNKIVEKPQVAYARENLAVEGLPDDMFLTFFGMHVLSPKIFEILQNHIKNNVRQNGEIQLTTAQAELCAGEGAVGLEIQGERLDMGTPLGLLETQLALALNGVFEHDIKLAFNRLQSKN